MLPAFKSITDYMAGLREEVETKALQEGLAAFKAKIGGNLFYVHTLPGLPVDGVLKPSFGRRGICIEENDSFVCRDKVTDPYPETIKGTGIATIHFSLNRHVDHPDYIRGVFVVLIPANEELLLQTTCMSFSETIIIGNYKLPKDSVIMVRKGHKVPDYYEKNNFKVIEFDDLCSNGINRNLDKKIEAVDKVIKELGGANLSIKKRGFGSHVRVLNRAGENINTPETFQKLFGKRPISFGTHEYTSPDTRGEHWRDWFAAGCIAFSDLRGDVGFSIEAYQSEKLNYWLEQLCIPAHALQTHLKMNKYNLIVFKAMDFIFDHFQEKKLAYEYISSHIKEYLAKLEKEGSLDRGTGFFTKKLEEDSIETLAKVICDYDYLKKQTRGTKFNLVTRDLVMQILINNLLPMHPKEAKNFLTIYFQKSSFISAFPEDQRLDMLRSLQNMYVLLYSNHPHVSEQMFQSAADILLDLYDPKFKLDLTNPENIELYFPFFITLHGEKWMIEQEMMESEKAVDWPKLLEEYFSNTFRRLSIYVAKRGLGFPSNEAIVVLPAAANDAKVPNETKKIRVSP